MIAGDTSAWVDYSKGLNSSVAKRFEWALREGALVIPNPVLFEVLSGPGITKQVSELVLRLPRLDTLHSCWERAATFRRRLVMQGLRARAMDCLIAQVCIDHAVPLITSDADFRHFVKFGLVLI